MMSYTQNSLESCSCCNSCINSDNVIPTLYETFKFIQAHPTDLNIQAVDCVLVLKISLLEYENNQSQLPVKTATNTIYANIKKVHPTYVELSYPTVENEMIDYTITYDKIITLGSSSLTLYNDEYIHTLSKLPPLCITQTDPSFDLLEQLHEILTDNSLTQQYSITFMPAGILSQPFNLADITLIKNLILIKDYQLIPITQLSGYVLKPLY